MLKNLLLLWCFATTSDTIAVQMSIMSPDILIEGEVPDGADPEKIRFTWETAQRVTGIRKYPPPYIWFAKFGYAKPPEWKVIWMQRNPTHAGEVQTKYYLAYSFPGSNRIQVAPFIFSGTYNGLGSGYYTIGHEMMHYLLEESVPVAEHHCYFKNQGLNQRLIDALVTAGISHPVLAQPSRFTIGEGC